MTPAALAQRIITRVQRRGSDATTLRDAAHEASHGIELGLRKWSREAIHQAVSALPRAEQFRSEVFARAVEAEVCVLCEESYDQDYYILIAHIEAVKGGIRFPPSFKDIVQEARKRPEVAKLVRRLKSLR